MDYTLEQKYARIREDALAAIGSDPVHIAHEIMRRDYINMHGPEHHFLDGAAFLAAYRNGGGEIDLDKALDELAKRTVKMPGAMCGQWGICGSAASVGAALAVIHKTGPLSTDEFYKDNMRFTSAAIAKMGEIGGARCCKRNAYLFRWERRRSFAMILRATGNVSVSAARSILRGIWISKNGGAFLQLKRIQNLKKLIDFLRKVCNNKTMRRKSC